MHPFLDVSKLTDEEITERLGKAYLYLSQQTALGHTPTVLSIKEVITSLETERHDRSQKIIEEETKRKFPKDREPISLGKLEEEIRKAL